VPELEAVINRFGFNNQACGSGGRARLKALKESGHWPSIPVGVNLGKSKVTPLEEANDDYVESFRRLRAYGDYFVLNVSSPEYSGVEATSGQSGFGIVAGGCVQTDTGGLALVAEDCAGLGVGCD